MGNNKGFTTITSAEYRELIEEKCDFRNHYHQIMKDCAKLEDEVRELRILHKDAVEESQQNSCLCDCYRGEIAALKEKLKAYESKEANNG